MIRWGTTLSAALMALSASGSAQVGRARADSAMPPPWTRWLPPPISREFRGVWVTPVDAMTGPDWPSRPGLTPDQQRAEMRRLLDRAKAIGLNAVVLHVRMAGDALYPS